MMHIASLNDYGKISPDRLQRVAGVTDHGDERLNQGHEPRELVLLAVSREDRLACMIR